MVTHHPDESLLLEYATGVLGEAKALLVATHITLCPACRNAVEAGEVASALLSLEAGEEPLSNDMPVPAAAPEAAHARHSRVLLAGELPAGFPLPLSGYLSKPVGDLAWKRTWFGIRTFALPQFTGTTAVRLLCIEPGRRMPRHTHDGEELTLVLKGSFSDATGTYQTGDVATADMQIDHQPRAGTLEDCICLAVEDAPLRMTGLFGRALGVVPSLFEGPGRRRQNRL